MGPGYLLDTNVIIYFLGGVLTEGGHEFLLKILRKPARVSIISKIELLSYQRLEERDIKVIDVFLSYSNLIYLYDDVVDQTIELRRINKRIKMPDAIIAATCMVNNLSLVTRNKADFANIAGLEVINPYDL